MLKTILPDTIDNTYSGRKIALWFFYLITTVTLIRSCIHIFKYDGGAQSIATIPLDTFTQSGADAVIFIFAYWGLGQLIMGIFYVLAAFKYKSMIPLMYVFLLVEYLGRFGISLFKSLETTGQAPGGVANYVLPGICFLMLFLSINTPKK